MLPGIHGRQFGSLTLRRWSLVLMGACALLAGVLDTPLAAQEESVSREISFFNDLQPADANQAVSREFSFFNDLEANVEGSVSRELSYLISPCPGVCLTIMPGYPNPPAVSPDDRKKARPDEPILVWGRVNEGGATFTDSDGTFEWTFDAPPGVTVDAAAALSGPITDNSTISVSVTFGLPPGSSSEVVVATLTVDVPGYGSDSKTVEIEIIPRANPGLVSFADLEVDTEIAVESALLFLIGQQNPNTGAFAAGVTGDHNDLATTAFSLWALQNHEHLATNDPVEDPYATPVQRGLDHLFNSLVILDAPADLVAPRADVARGAIADDVSDLNGNGQVIAFDATSSKRGYIHPIAMTAVLASGSPNLVVQTGPAAGMTYGEVIEDAIDYLGHTMNQGATTFWGGRGGWDYNAAYTSGRSDMSINSWAYLALEGAQVQFGITVPDWMKQEIEHTLANHYAFGRFGYTGPNACYPQSLGMATTGGGLSGLALVETAGPFVEPGEVLTTQGSLEDIDARRAMSLAYLGDNWDTDQLGAYCLGNRGNYYAMWTVARALRLTAIAVGLPEEETIELINDTPYPDPAGPADPILFDWEAGEIVDPLTGELAGEGHPREGYIPFLLRNQVLDGTTPETQGYWSSNTGGWISNTLETTFALLVLSRRVFGPDCPDGATPSIVELSPTTPVPAGGTVTITGRALAVNESRPITAVSINGAPVDAIDATGRFFKSVPIELGANSFRIDVYDTSCGTESTFEIEGVPAGELVYEQFVIAESLIEASYEHTTFQHTTSQLLVTARACNVSSGFSLLTPALMVFEAFNDPSVTPANPDGFTPDGEPYVFFGAGSLAPGECSDARVLVFDNPNQVPVLFEVRWMVPNNEAPVFETVPVTEAEANAAYEYAATAVDPRAKR